MGHIPYKYAGFPGVPHQQSGAMVSSKASGTIFLFSFVLKLSWALGRKAMGKMRTLDFNPAHVKDDPARTADYGYFHHERDIEPETVSEAEAARMIAQAVANETAAYGYLPDDLVDSILNFGHQEMRDLFLAALFPGAYPNQTDATRRRILSACESIANEYEGESWSR